MDPTSALARFIRRVMRDTAFHGIYPATLEVDRGDGTVDILPDNAFRGVGFAKIPVLKGIAGTTENVAVGTRCLFAFANGSPSAPRVVAWEYKQGSATVRLDGGTASIARQGDVVKMAGGPGFVVMGTISGTMNVTNPSPPPATIPTPMPPGTNFVGTVTLPPYLYGQIQKGARRVKA